jgi:hypothetical protein
MRWYLTAGVVMGLLQLLDAAVLILNKGHVKPYSALFAGVEFLWALTSLVLIFCTRHQPTRFLALAFFGYNAVGWILSIFVMDRTTPIVPMWFLGISFAFGLAYAAASYYFGTKI